MQVIEITLFIKINIFSILGKTVQQKLIKMHLFNL